MIHSELDIWVSLAVAFGFGVCFGIVLGAKVKAYARSNEAKVDEFIEREKQLYSSRRDTI